MASIAYWRKANIVYAYMQDAYSYDLEQSRGDDTHNMLTCIMNSEDLLVKDAMSLLREYISALEDRFLIIRSHLQGQAGAEPADPSLLAYVDGIGNWVRANDAWSFESQRYFGPRGLEIQARRTLNLRPKRLPS
jgi:Delta6-protoilludene synthase